jgi:hypothetical protein
MPSPPRDPASVNEILGAQSPEAPTTVSCSVIFFAREFAERLIELGRRDAERWLNDPSHDHGKWQLGPLP